MSLTATEIRNAKPRDKAYKLFDEKGLYLLVNPNGSKLWKVKYRFGGAEKKLACGAYPDVSLAEAREKRDEARRLLAKEADPSLEKKLKKQALKLNASNNFEAVAREWFVKFSTQWVPSHSEKIIRRLERDVFPWLGHQPINEITPPELLAVLQRIETRGALETAHRAQQNCSQIFRYAVASGRTQRDVTVDLKGALPPTKVEHHAAITEPSKVSELLRAIEGYKGFFVTKCALRLAPLLFVRPGELRHAQWTEFSFESKEWNIPADRMKMRQAHLVPLSVQAINILQELHPLTSNSKYVFPSIRTNNRPMSDNTINAALRRLGYDSSAMTAHGFRAMARTILDEVLDFRPDIIEHQLAHAVKDPNGRAYNRTAHLEARREMMQGWASYLYKLADF